MLSSRQQIPPVLLTLPRHLYDRPFSEMGPRLAPVSTPPRSLTTCFKDRRSSCFIHSFFIYLFTRAFMRSDVRLLVPNRRAPCWAHWTRNGHTLWVQKLPHDLLSCRSLFPLLNVAFPFRLHLGPDSVALRATHPRSVVLQGPEETPRAESSEQSGTWRALRSPEERDTDPDTDRTPAPPRSSWVTLSKLLNLSVHQFPHL